MSSPLHRPEELASELLGSLLSPPSLLLWVGCGYVHTLLYLALPGFQRSKGRFSSLSGKHSAHRSISPSFDLFLLLWLKHRHLCAVFTATCEGPSNGLLCLFPSSLSFSSSFSLPTPPYSFLPSHFLCLHLPPSLHPLFSPHLPTPKCPTAGTLRRLSPFLVMGSQLS